VSCRVAQATESVFKSVEDLANIWCEWAEMEIRNNKYGEALRVMQQAVADPPRRGRDLKYSELPIQDKVHKNLRVWSLYIDLEVRVTASSCPRACVRRSVGGWVCWRFREVVSMCCCCCCCCCSFSLLW
jgi:hypothetical protein